MSVHVNLKSPHKKQLANVLRSIGDMIEASGNDTITVTLEVIFNQREKAPQ